MTKLTLPENVTISGPYYEFCNPYGGGVTLEHDEWFVSRKLKEDEQKTEFQKICGSACLGSIVRFRGKRKYIISQLYPDKRFSTLQKAVDFLIKNEGKLVFCT